jgi:hypothetical protein
MNGQQRRLVMATKKSKKFDWEKIGLMVLVFIMGSVVVLVIGFITWVDYGKPQDIIKPTGQEIMFGEIVFGDGYRAAKMEVYFGDAHSPITIYPNNNVLGVYDVPDGGQESVEIKYNPISGGVLWAKFHFLESKDPNK